MEEKKECKGCHKVTYIKNKHFKLCCGCNTERLNEGKQKSGTNIPSQKKSFLKKPKTDNSYFINPIKKRKGTQEKILEDELFYEECFNNCKKHECEECGAELPNYFRDGEGKVAARWRFSHIFPKSTHPHLRHKVENINHLCLKHHTQWDFGDKENMKIYDKNKKSFPSQFLPKSN